MKKYLAMALVAAATFAAVIAAVNYNKIPLDFYQAKSLVTGQPDETRLPGFERALVDALKKISGDPGISAGEVLAAVGGPVCDQVQDYSERDRMAVLRGTAA